MPSFDDHAQTSAAPEEVWKALYDPSRFPEWWAGFKRATEGTGQGADVTLYPTGYPDFPLPQRLSTHAQERRVTVSCMVSDLCFDWRLEALDGDAGTRIAVHVEIPEREAARLATSHSWTWRSSQPASTATSAAPAGPVACSAW